MISIGHTYLLYQIGLLCLDYLLYLDCTNLYGMAMTKPLPLSGFRWLERDEIDAVDVHTLRDNVF